MCLAIGDGLEFGCGTVCGRDLVRTVTPWIWPISKQLEKLAGVAPGGDNIGTPIISVLNQRVQQLSREYGQT